MDNFMDKLAQKLTAQEMIKANAAADAKELERLQNQLMQYDACLQDMRKLSLKNIEASDKLTALLDAAAAKISSIEEKCSEEKKQDYAEILQELEKQKKVIEEIKQCLEKNEEMVHKENVKVYRNVQAVIVEENKKQLSEIEMIAEDSAGRSTPVLIFAILAFAAGLANIVIELLIHFGVF